MHPKLTRRQMLRLTGQAVAFGALAGSGCVSRKKPSPAPRGTVIGETTGAAAGIKMLADGGNAFDAIVTAALVAAVANPAKCGIGGYGGHATLALAGSKKIISVDFNSTAP